MSKLGVCSFAGCENVVRVKRSGLCQKHDDLLPKPLKPVYYKDCQAPGCDLKVVARGLCSKHYTRLIEHGDYATTRRPDWGKRINHPRYWGWDVVRRKCKEGCVKEWEDFWVFIKDIGEKPGPNYRLKRHRIWEPWGPDNFYWKEQIPNENRAEYARIWRNRNPEKTKNSVLLKTFGITLEHYHELFTKQGGKCYLCYASSDTERFGSLSVDHNHATGKVRALLCKHCNTGIGSFKEDVDLLERAIDYLLHSN